jgi:hypothetical protein
MLWRVWINLEIIKFFSKNTKILKSGLWTKGFTKSSI